MKTKHFTLFVLLLPLLFSGCEKFTIDNASTDQSDANGNVTLQASISHSGSDYEGKKTRTSDDEADLSDICSRLTFCVFNGNTKVKTINQLSGDDDFGTVSLSLASGTYKVVVIAHSGKGNCTISSPDKIKFYNNKLTDTFFHYGTLEVGEEEIEQEIHLTRAVAMIRLHTTDTTSDNVKQLKFYYTGGSSTLDATTGYGCVNSKQTETLEASSSTTDYSVYTFPHEDGQKVKLQLTVLDASSNEISSKTLENIPVKRNYITTCTGTLFEGQQSGGSSSESGTTTTGGVNFTWDAAWAGEQSYTF